MIASVFHTVSNSKGELDYFSSHIVSLKNYQNDSAAAMKGKKERRLAANRRKDVRNGCGDP